ncbi:MAG TPA: alpha/beta fold hydrolase [Candidatus Thermoplasmatota archaeon]|nr:alpha/beta fold hydrolase [Candidatus Thermoplasmatota archaeon]
MALKTGWPDLALGGLYPFEDQYFQLSDGTTMHYVEMGKAGLRRPTILLLHGSPTWSFLWRRFLQPLSRHARVIAVDHVGFGRSDHPEDPRYYSLERHIRNLEELAAGLGLKRVVPVVQDWGGPIGLGWATRHPDKLAGLFLMNTWAFTERMPARLPWWFKALKAPGVGELAYRRRNLYVEGFLRRLLRKPPTPEVMAGYRHPFPTPKSRTGVLAAARMIPTGPKHPDWATLAKVEKGLLSLDVPARIVWGAKDPAFAKRFAWAFAEALPRAGKPTFLEEGGHFLPEDEPDQLIAEIEAFTRGL